MPINLESTPMTTCTTCWRIFKRFGDRCRHRPPLVARAFSPASWRRGGTRVDAALKGCAAFSVLLLALVGVLAAQEAKDSWTTYHGDYSGRRHSSLTQVTPANVHQLGLAWAFSTGQTQPIKATPILADGVI